MDNSVSKLKQIKVLLGLEKEEVKPIVAVDTIVTPVELSIEPIVELAVDTTKIEPTVDQTASGDTSKVVEPNTDPIKMLEERVCQLEDLIGKMAGQFVEQKESFSKQIETFDTKVKEYANQPAAEPIHFVKPEKVAETKTKAQLRIEALDAFSVNKK